MGFYQSYTFSSVATFLSDLAEFAGSNGWTVDAQSSTSVSITKGASTFRVDYGDASKVFLYANAGGGYNPTGIYVNGLTSGAIYKFVSCGSSIYIARSYGGKLYWGGLATIIGRVGGWDGGVGVLGLDINNYNIFFQANTKFKTFYINGVWTPPGTGTEAGGVVGSIGLVDSIAAKQPFLFNAGIMPVPVMIFTVPADTTKLQPLGYAEGVYVFRNSGLYDSGDELVIDSTPYLAMENGASSLNESGASALLFKLG